MCTGISGKLLHWPPSIVNPDMKLAACVHNLHDINLAKYEEVTDAGLAHLSSLHALNFRECEEVTDDGTCSYVIAIAPSTCITSHGVH